MSTNNQSYPMISILKKIDSLNARLDMLHRKVEALNRLPDGCDYRCYEEYRIEEQIAAIKEVIRQLIEKKQELQRDQ